MILASSITHTAADPIVTLVILVCYALYQGFSWLKKEREESANPPPRPSSSPPPVPSHDPDPFAELLEALGRKTETPPVAPAPPPLRPTAPIQRRIAPVLIEEDEGPTPPELARIPVAPTLTDFQLPTFRTMIEQNKSVTAVEQDAYVQTAVANLPFAQGLDKPPGLDLPRGQLRRLIAQPGSLRQAIMLNEVLGPARAFTLDSAQFSVGRSVG